MGSPGRGVAGAKNDLKNSLNKFDDFSYVIEAMIVSVSPIIGIALSNRGIIYKWICTFGMGMLIHLKIQDII